MLLIKEIALSARIVFSIFMPDLPDNPIEFIEMESAVVHVKAIDNQPLSSQSLQNTIRYTMRKLPHIPQIEGMEKLLMETAAIETYNGQDIRYGTLDKGVFQVRKSTAKYLLNYIKNNNKEVYDAVMQFYNKSKSREWNLVHNVPFGAALSSTYYWHVEENLEHNTKNIYSRADLWRRKYNVNRDKSVNKKYIARTRELQRKGI